MDAEPPINYALSPDTSQISTVYAEMTFFRESERSFENFTTAQRAAFERWQGTVEAGIPTEP